MRSWRTASVALLSFSSGLPLGLVWIAIPDWMRSAGIDLHVVGLLTLAQAPWSFKFVWSPLMDRFRPPFLGGLRGWALIAQVFLLGTTLLLPVLNVRPESAGLVIGVAFLIGLAAASQDIAIDAYTVNVLREDEQGVAVGARTATYRAAMLLSGRTAISLSARMGWGAVQGFLALLYLPMMLVTWRAPEPEQRPRPVTTLRQAVWYPFLGFLSRHRSLEILAFVVFYKLTDNLGGALLSPFLVDMGYTKAERGVMLGLAGILATVAGTFMGGALTTVLGLGRSLWAFGLVQILSNVGYVALSTAGHRPGLMYSAMFFETFTQGLGTGAFGVLLLRLTQKRFSATQFALFSSMFAIPRIVSGPIAGFTVEAIGWTNFFWLTMAAGIPGLVLLARFVPLGVREPEFTVESPTRRRAPLTPRALFARGVLGGALGLLVVGGGMALLNALKGLRAKPQRAFDVVAEAGRLIAPADAEGWVTTLGIVLTAVLIGLFAAAVAAARTGALPIAEEGEG
jgi:PAT family beta-lactamase induction signal transducer AmpG